jgi:glycosyltransferase involved in cell wall biosynthesis
MLAVVSPSWLRPTDTLGAARDTTVVCLVHDRARPNAGAATLTALDERTAIDVPLIVLGVEREDEATLAAIEGLKRRTLVIGSDAQANLSELLNRAAGAAGQADLALLSAGCRVPSGWLERLRGAACSDSTVATATPMSSDGGAVRVLHGGGDDADRMVATVARRARPRLLVGGPHCLYVRRCAIELIGGFRDGYDTLAQVSASCCEHCLQAGMLNVLADDLYLDCDQRVEDLDELPAAQLSALDHSDERTALRRAVSLASAALGGLSVTIDARSLGPTVGGTQRYTRELALALARSGGAEVRLVVAHDLSASAAAEIADAPGVVLVTYEQAVAGVEPTHIVHRPQQVFSAADLSLLQLLGRRLVITHQDLIAYHNPSYHATFESWEQYRRITRIALAAADRVVFFSEHSLRDAESEDLVTRHRCDVVGAAIGAETAGELRGPAGAPRNSPFILYLGPDYRHKNRCFAIELLGALRAQQSWDGKLVLAGAHVPHGSSRAEETELLERDEDLRGSVIDLGSVDEPGRAWLFANASAVVVPSIVEGFGLVPLEAAQAGLPCLYAPQSSLVEVVGADLATLVAWDAAESARCVVPLLRSGSARTDHVQGLRAAAARWTWDGVAEKLVQSYEHAMRSPYRAGAVRAWQELERERYLVDVFTAHQDLLQRLGNRIALAAEDGFLTAREQQGLLRVGARAPLRRLTLWPFALLGSIQAPRRER